MPSAKWPWYHYLAIDKFIIQVIPNGWQNLAVLQGLTHWPLGDSAWNFRLEVIFSLILLIDGWVTSCEIVLTWWRHQMETFSALLALCGGNPPVTGEFPAPRPVTRSFDVFFDLCLNKLFSKQSWGRRFETPSQSLWLHCNAKLPSDECQ